MLQPQIDDDDKNCQRDQQKIVLLRSTQRNAKNLAGAGKPEIPDRHRVDQGDPLWPVGDIDRRVEIVEKNAHDFAKAEGHNGQIVAAQLERWRAEQDPEDTGDGGADRQNDPKRPVQAEVRAGEQRIDIGADGVESDVAEIEQAGEANDDVEAECQENVKNCEIEDAHPRLPAQRGNEGQRDQRRSDQQDADRRTRSEPLVHARSPVFSPNRPEGLNINTTISTTKAKMSW